MSMPGLPTERVTRARREAIGLVGLAELDAPFAATYTGNREAVRLTDAEVSALSEGTEPVDVLALVDVGCTDVMATLPVMAAITDSVPRFRLSVLHRPANPDLADRYAGPTGSRIPTYVFLDEAGADLGTIVERTPDVDARVVEFLTAARAADPRIADPASLPDRDRDEFMQRVLAFRASLGDVERASLVAEVVRLTAQRRHTA